MNILTTAKILSLAILISFFSHIASANPDAISNTYTIGVLAKRGEQIALRRWSATADYLTQQIPRAEFHIAPLRFTEVEPAIRSKEIDFLLVNSGIYIKAEHDFGAFRIATLINNGDKHAVNQFGAVIFTRHDNHSLNRVSELNDLTFAAVSPTSLGGFLMAMREMRDLGIDTEKDLSLRFMGTHDAVVKAVLAGQVDAGTVRTDTLERMQSSGLLTLNNIKVLDQKKFERFPYLVSTRLYPEWPMAALPHTAKSLVKMTTIALLNLPSGHPAARSSNIFGWNVPANYTTVHELYSELNIPPHRRHPPTLMEWSRHHPYTVLFSLTSLLIISASLILLARYNQRLRKTQHSLSTTIHKLRSTESKLKENLLKLTQSENKFTQLAKSALDAIIMLDSQGNIEFWNPAASTIFGYNQQEAKKLQLSQWIVDIPGQSSDQNPHTGHILSYIGNSDDPLPGKPLELEAIRKSGDFFPIEASISSIFLQDGWYVICLIRDITQRKSIEAEREQMTLQLTQNHKMTALAHLADGIAHEINTPIQTINNNLAFLQDAYQDSRALISTLIEYACEIVTPSQHSEKFRICQEKIEDTELDYLDKEVTATLEQSRQGIEQVSRIVRSMRIFTTPESNTFEKTDLNRLIDDVLRISRYQWEPISELETNLDDTLPMVECFPSELHQAIINMIMNAVQAVEESPNDCRGKITVVSKHEGNHVIIEIGDNGNGIPEVAQEYIFNPFFTTRDIGRGTGQGLTLCHDIVVRKHAGSIDFSTQPGKGTTFIVKLPIKQTVKSMPIER